MKPRTTDDMFRPFQDLKSLLESRSISCKPSAAPIPARKSLMTPAGEENESTLFLEAMADVSPLPKSKPMACRSGNRQIRHVVQSDESHGIWHLHELITHGKGFVVSHTPEYVEGIGYQVHPSIAHRLHRGDFSVQAHIDLHGMNVLKAGESFETFLEHAVATGKKTVLIVHGRGLCSPGTPVLKSKVIEWLTSTTWRKWIIAFTSARICDGGAGALYVLLRNRPVPKRLRKTAALP